MADIKKIQLPDGTSYDIKDTTYTFADSIDGFTVTPSNGTPQTVTVGGTLGISDNGGLFYPTDLTPTKVGKGSLLVTEGHNTFLGNKSLSVTTGMNLTVTSTALPSNTFNVTNTYINRILCTIALNGVACLNEQDAANTVAISSITVNGVKVTPSSTNNNTNIVIKLAEPIGESGKTVTSIRIYPKQDGFSNLLFGVANTTGNGYSTVGGQQVGNASNASAVFGNTQWNQGNSSILAGRQHINTKQNAALFGIGHDTTNASTEVAAVGKWSNLDSSTLFAIGNGSSNTQRSNALKVTSNTATFSGRVIAGADPVDSMDLATKQYVDSHGGGGGGATTFTFTLSADDWPSSLTRTQYTPGVTASNVVQVSPAPASINTYVGCGVYCSAQASDSLTFKCSTVPTKDITVYVVIWS